jgi:hypothetical protein
MSILFVNQGRSDVNHINWQSTHHPDDFAVLIGWAQRALPIAVDTRPDRNRGYTGPIKSCFGAVTNAHPARKLVNTLSHLSRFFGLRLVRTHFLTIRAKSKGVSFLASAAVLHESHWLQLSPSLPSRELSIEPRVAFTHETFMFFRPITTCTPDNNALSTAVNFWGRVVQFSICCARCCSHARFKGSFSKSNYL